MRGCKGPWSDACPLQAPPAAQTPLWGGSESKGDKEEGSEGKGDKSEKAPAAEPPTFRGLGQFQVSTADGDGCARGTCKSSQPAPPDRINSARSGSDLHCNLCTAEKHSSSLLTGARHAGGSPPPLPTDNTLHRRIGASSIRASGRRLSSF